MIQWLKDKIKARRAKAKLARFNAGYDYAAGVMLRGRNSSIKEFGDYRRNVDFDRGIDQAISDWHRGY